MSRVNLGLLQMREKFAREALLDMPANAPAAERAAAMKRHSDAIYVHAHGLREVLAAQKLRGMKS
jgi:hypothetical protein